MAFSFKPQGFPPSKLGRTIEANAAYAKIEELEAARTTAIIEHSMASNVDEATSNVVTRTNTFSSTDSEIYSWLSLGHVLRATVDWHWYSPDGNPYETGSVDIPRNPSGGYWSSYNVWYNLDITDIPPENLTCQVIGMWISTLMVRSA